MEAEAIRKEKEIWEIVNRERRKRKRINESLGWEEWKKNFMRLLGGVKDRVVRGNGSDIKGRDEEEEISREEIKRAIGKLKNGKAAGMDRIPNEV